MKKKALILVDIQNDFVKNGSLAVLGGEEIIPVVNLMLENHHNDYSLILETQDWHPKNHIAFASQHRGKKPGDVILLSGKPQILWPDHCIQNSVGAQIVPSLSQNKIQKIIQKGMNPRIDSYSAFFDNDHTSQTELHEFLKLNQIKELHMVGLAFDFCVKFTALDAVQLGYDVHVFTQACRGVYLAAGDQKKTQDEMIEAGIKLI